MRHDWKDVEMPPGITGRPRDPRGFPITFVTLIEPDGRPDFTTIDGAKVMRCIQEGLCGMCGEGWPDDPTHTDDRLLAFVGGPLSIENRNFLDPPMHVACAEYAMRVCPHIATPTARYSKPKEGRDVFDAVLPDRPDRFGLYVTDACQVAPYQGQPIFFPNPPLRLEWVIDPSPTGRKDDD